MKIPKFCRMGNNQPSAHCTRCRTSSLRMAATHLHCPSRMPPTIYRTWLVRWSFRRLMGWQLTQPFLSIIGKPEKRVCTLLMVFMWFWWCFMILWCFLMVICQPIDGFYGFDWCLHVFLSHQIPIDGRLTIWFGDLFHMGEHLEPSLFSCRKLYHTLQNVNLFFLICFSTFLGGRLLIQ